MIVQQMKTKGGILRKLIFSMTPFVFLYTFLSKNIFTIHVFHILIHIAFASPSENPLLRIPWPCEG